MDRRRGRTRDPYRWWQVNRHAWCARAAHEVPAGTWMRTRRDDHRQLHSCEVCLAALGVTRLVRPDRPFTFNGEAPDVRARQTGGDE